VTEYFLKVTANTADAQQKLDQVDKAADTATRPRKLDIDLSGVNTAVKNLNTGIHEAANNIKSLYGVAKMLPGIGDPLRDIDTLINGIKKAPQATMALKEASGAGHILASSMDTAKKASMSLVDQLARVGFALFAVKQTVGVLQQAYTGFFDNTIGREIQLRETMLKTQTTLASTNRVFKDGKEVTDPYQKIVSLTGEIEKRIASIRDRTIELAGVTSNDVIEVFGIVASQIGQVGGGLKDAEDMAVGLAAALGTFGLPLEQARQEIGSMLRGDINMDSYLAHALGITNKDITDARSKAGGVIKFVNDKLAAAVAGQKIAAEGFSGVMSNIVDLWELVNQRFGAGLLDPLLNGLSSTFEFLFKIREQVFAIAEGAGRATGRLAAVTLGRIGEGSKAAQAIGGPDVAPALDKAKTALSDAFGFIQASISRVMAPLTQIFDGISQSIATVGKGLFDLAKAFVSLQVGNIQVILTTIQTLIPVVTSLATAFSGVLSVYGELLKLPLVQYITQLNVQFGFLRQTGLNTITTIISVGTFVVQTWKPILPLLITGFTVIKAGIASTIAMIGGAIRFVGNLVKAFIALIESFAASSAAAAANSAALAGNAAALEALSVKAQGAANAVNNFGKGINGTNIRKFIMDNLAMTGGLLALQVAITVVIDLWGRYQKRLSEIAEEKRGQQAIKDLAGAYKDVGEESTTAEKRQKAYLESLKTSTVSNYETKIREYTDKIKAIEKENATVIKRAGGSEWALPMEMQLYLDGRRVEVKNLKKERDRIQAELGKIDIAEDKAKLEANIKIQAQQNVGLIAELAKQRKQLEDSIGDQRRSLENAVFQKQQETRQKEIENARAAGELRIQAVERANIKMLEGEQGSSRAALEAVVAYLSTKKKGELDIELAKKSMQLEFANMEKALANFKIETERQIYNMRIAVGEYEKKLEQFKTGQEQLRSNIRKNDAADGVGGDGAAGTGGETGGGQSGPTRGHSTGPHLHVQLVGNGNLSDLRKMVDSALDFGGSSISTKYGSGADTHRRYPGRALDFEIPQGTPFTLRPGWTQTNLGVRGDLGLGARFTGPNGEAFEAGHLQKVLSGGTNAAGASANDDFFMRYAKRVSNLEGGYGVDGSAALSPKTGARGYFQLTPDTKTSLLSLGYTDVVKHLLSSDFNTAAKGFKEYAIIARPKAKELFEQENRAELDKTLNPIWTSLPGGTEQAKPAVMARANRYLSTTSSAARAAATVAPPTAPTFDASIGQRTIDQVNQAQASLQATMERSRQIQTDITKANTAKAFEDIAKASFPKVNLEQYRDQNIELKETLTTLNAISSEQLEVVTPEQLDLTTQYQKTLKVIAEERKDYIKGLDKLMAKPDNEMTKAEYDRLVKTYDEGRKKNAADLEAEFVARTKLINQTKEVKAVQDLVNLAITEGKKIRESDVEILTKSQTILAGNNIYLQHAAALEGLIAKYRTTPEGAAALKTPAGAKAIDVLRRGSQVDAAGEIAAELARLKYDATTGNDLMIKAARASNLGQRAAAYGEGDYYGKRRAEAEAKITERRLDLEAKGLLAKESEIAEFQAFAKATRDSAASLAAMDKETTAFINTMSLIQNVSRSIVDGQKNFIKAALTGGDTGQAMEEMLKGITDTILNSMLDAAFKPVQQMLEKQFKDFLGVQDPVKIAQEANTTALGSVKTALDGLTTAITSKTTEIAGAANGIVPLTPGVSSGKAVDSVATEAANATQNLADLGNSCKVTSSVVRKTGESAVDIPKNFSGLQQAIGGVVGALAGIGMGIAGVNQMKKGGTYNTLMGIAGIFGGISSLAGAFTPGGGLGKLFGFRAAGGPVSANSPYIVGENGPELFTPGSSGHITSNEDLFAGTRSALGGSRRSSPEDGQAMAAAGPIDVRFESRVINNVEYVTADQHRKGMQQAAERGRALAYEGLQRSVNTRRRLGV